MSEPSKIGGKTRPQLNAQIDRIWEAAKRAYENASTESERRRILDRYNRAGDAYSNYMDAMNSSRRMDAAIRRYIKETGGLGGDIAGYLDRVSVPRSQYMRNNRRK